MIITCASCLTRFNLDDHRIPSKGAKVRCSRCRHVFLVLPAHETKEEAKHGDDQEELTGPSQKEVKLPLQIEEEEKTEEPILSEKAPPEPEKKEKEEKKKEERKGKVFTAKKTAQKERKGPSLFFILIVIVVLLIFAAFYLLTELGSGGKLLPYLQYPIKKITEFWQQIF
jgi:predicted Zn finger-like uncharacterized protein